MDYKPYAVFGNVLVRCNALRGEEYPLQDTRKLGWRYITKGSLKTSFKSGGTKIYYPGDLIEDTEVVSNRRVDFLEDCEWFCLSHLGNSMLVMPKVIALDQESTINLKKDSDVFIACGEVFVDNKQYSGPYALRVRSDDVSLTAANNSYLLQFR